MQELYHRPHEVSEGCCIRLYKGFHQGLCDFSDFGSGDLLTESTSAVIGVLCGCTCGCLSCDAAYYTPSCMERRFRISRFRGLGLWALGL